MLDCDLSPQRGSAEFVSSTVPENEGKCARCAQPLAPGALACDRCDTLVHAGELELIASRAKELEAESEHRKAREVWLSCLPLLPTEAKQAEWIRNHSRELELAAIKAESSASRNPWARRLAPLGPLGIMLAKGKGLLAIFKLKFLLSFVAFIGVYWTSHGARWAIGFAVLILIHEMGHFIDVRRRGLPADMPVFLPGLGAYVRWQALGVSAQTRAAISLAGPLAGWISAAACALLWFKTGNSLWAALAYTGAGLNVLNLIPVWVLDGGQAASAMDKSGRVVLLMVSLVLAWVLGQSLFFFVAAGAAYRLFTKDLPAEPSRGTTLYFVALLTLLGLLMWALPAAAK